MNQIYNFVQVGEFFLLGVGKGGEVPSCEVTKEEEKEKNVPRSCISFSSLPK